MDQILCSLILKSPLPDLGNVHRVPENADPYMEDDSQVVWSVRLVMGGESHSPCADKTSTDRGALGVDATPLLHTVLASDVWVLVQLVYRERNAASPTTPAGALGRALPLDLAAAHDLSFFPFFPFFLLPFFPFLTFLVLYPGGFIPATL